MGKISPVSIKYNIYASIELTGVAEKPDIIGAVFGQTEGLLGPDLELRELQKSGKIGRIDVHVDSKKGKTSGEIIVPSSMGKSETAIVGAAIETIDRVGPSDSKIRVTSIKDIRESKRDFILKRAKELLKNLVGTLPDSKELKTEVMETVRTGAIGKYGADNLPVGPGVEESEDIIVVEGRADVLNLMKYGMNNVIGMNGARFSDTILKLAREKSVTLFVDGDRGGDLIIKNLAGLTDIDSIAKAPDGKEVEELTQKEIQKALRSAEKWKDMAESKEKPKPRGRTTRDSGRDSRTTKRTSSRTTTRTSSRTTTTRRPREITIPDSAASKLKEMAEELVGSRGAFVLDKSLQVLGRVPVKELKDTLENIGDGVHAIVLDGSADANLVKVAEGKRIKYVIVKGKPSITSSRVKIVEGKTL